MCAYYQLFWTDWFVTAVDHDPPLLVVADQLLWQRMGWGANFLYHEKLLQGSDEKMHSDSLHPPPQRTAMMKWYGNAADVIEMRGSLLEETAREELKTQHSNAVLERFLAAPIFVAHFLPEIGDSCDASKLRCEREGGAAYYTLRNATTGDVWAGPVWLVGGGAVSNNNSEERGDCGMMPLEPILPADGEVEAPLMRERCRAKTGPDHDGAEVLEKSGAPPLGPEDDTRRVSTVRDAASLFAEVSRDLGLLAATASRSSSNFDLVLYVSFGSKGMEMSKAALRYFVQELRRLSLFGGIAVAVYLRTPTVVLNTPTGGEGKAEREQGQDEEVDVAALVTSFLEEVSTEDESGPPSTTSEPSRTGGAGLINPSKSPAWKFRLLPFFVPQERLFAIATVSNTKKFVYVSHGGAGGLAEAVAHGIPVLCLPLYADQPWNLCIEVQICHIQI
eukprot:g14094.t1